MPPLRDTLSRRSKMSCNRSYSPLLCRSRKIRQLILERWPAFSKFNFHANTTDAKAVWIFDSLQKSRDALLSGKRIVKGHTAHIRQDSAATAPMSTLLICSSFCVVNFTVNLLRRLIERLPLFGGETQQASTTGMLACCLTPPWDTLSRGSL